MGASTGVFKHKHPLQERKGHRGRVMKHDHMQDGLTTGCGAESESRLLVARSRGFSQGVSIETMSPHSEREVDIVTDSHGVAERAQPPSASDEQWPRAGPGQSASSNCAPN